MKKFLLYATAILIASSSFAQLPADGYYRVQNAFTKRYAYLLDDKGSIDEATTTIDVGALKLYSNDPHFNSDPANVFYIEHAKGLADYKYDICGQGTSIYGLIKEYVDVIVDRKPYDGRQSYMLYGSRSTVSKYIGDIWNDLDDNEGLASSEAKGDDRKWYFNPVDVDTDQYFGVAPTLQADGKYYNSLYAAFPFSAYSNGVKFYTVTSIEKEGVAIISEVDGIIPAATPIIVECSSPSVSDNRLNVGPDGTASSVSGNMLKGVYFDNSSRTHYNRKAYDKESMRVLGVKDGKLAFVQADIDFLPRNQAYLQLTDPSQYATSEFLVMTKEEYEAGVNVIPVSANVDVYSLDGRLVKSGIAKDEVSVLGKGLYIIRKAGLSEKIVIR